MNYDQYECTPLFSYKESKAAIRHMKAEQSRQYRNEPLTSKASGKTRNTLVKTVVSALASIGFVS